MAESSKYTYRPPTIKEVAERARVSPATVSFVINKTKGQSFSTETKERVWAAVEDLGYRPNPAAQALRTRTSNFVGFVADAVATTPFAVDLIKGAQDCAKERGKLLLVIDADGNAEQRERAFEVMLEQRVEGIVYAAMFHQEIELFDRFRDLPVVLVDCYTKDNIFPAVVPDEIQGGQLATEQLIAKGHRRIAMLANAKFTEGYPAPIGRLEGYKRALENANLPFDDELVFEGDSHASTGYSGTRQLMQLRDPPTALFCGTDRMAMGSYDALKELGLGIPDDVAVIGFDNQEIIAAFLRPPLSTVMLPHYSMGWLAIERLFDTHSRDRQRHLVPCPFVPRESI